MTSFEGDTGPYLQYAHARLCSMTRKSGLKREDLESADLSLLTEEHATDLVRLLAQWPDVVLNTYKTLEPTTVLTYLFRMTHILSSGYDVLKVIGSEPEVAKARMALYESARQVLYNGMRLLGLSPVDRYVVVILFIYTYLTNCSLGCDLFLFERGADFAGFLYLPSRKPVKSIILAWKKHNISVQYKADKKERYLLEEDLTNCRNLGLLRSLLTFTA